LGKHGLHLHLLSLGVDERVVEPERVAKSIGHETTFSQDITSIEQAKAELLSLSAKAVRRLRRHNLVSTTITLKVKYHNFQQSTRSVTLPEPISDRRVVFQHCCNLLEKTTVGKKPVRLLGVSLSRLRPTSEQRQRSLFTEDSVFSKCTRLDNALDDIQNRFGDDAIFPSTLLKK
jgi:DNA polymerase-4